MSYGGNMNTIQLLNESLNFIETKLSNGEYEELTPKKISKIAYMSAFHYQRCFSMLSGYSLGEYIRKRKLSLATQDLIIKKHKVITIAAKFGYESPEAFSKAFKRFHGIPPSKIYYNKTILKAFPPLSFQLTMKGATIMNYKIIKKESFKVTGYNKKITTVNNENFNILPQFWNEVMDNGSYTKLEDVGLEINPNNSCMGICYNQEPEKNQFDYLIAMKGSFSSKLENSIEITIPASNWAVFECKGPLPEAIQKVWKKIYSEWFPATNYEHAGTAELEIYLGGDTSSEDYICEIWIPLKEK